MTQVHQAVSRHTIQESTGNLAVNQTSAEIEIQNWTQAIVSLHVEALVMPDGDDEVDFYVQMRYDDVWTDVANVHFANAQEPIATAERLIKIGPLAAGVATITPTDTTLADNTAVNLPVGDAIRIKGKVTGATAPTYAYSASVAGWSIG